MSLWVTHLDGFHFDLFWQATTDEVYTTDELMEDLSDCTAKQVYVVADQSFSGRLAEALQNSESLHPKVTVFTSGSKHDYSWASELTNEWARANHTDYCVTTIYEVSMIAKGSF